MRRAAIVVITTMLATSAMAQDIVRINPFIGAWDCSGFGNAPLGILTIGNPMYDFQAVDADWQTVESEKNGSGIMTFGNGTALPFGGPLLEQFAATGSFVDDSLILNWEGAEGFRMTCVQQHQ